MCVIKLDDTGTVKSLYNEGLTPFLSGILGKPAIKRWSNIEYSNDADKWQVTIQGSVVYESGTRQSCVEWEHREYERRN